MSSIIGLGTRLAEWFLTESQSFGANHMHYEIKSEVADLERSDDIIVMSLFPRS